jgi:hypothetical protein
MVRHHFGHSPSPPRPSPCTLNHPWACGSDLVTQDPLGSVSPHASTRHHRVRWWHHAPPVTHSNHLTRATHVRSADLGFTPDRSNPSYQRLVQRLRVADNASSTIAPINLAKETLNSLGINMWSKILALGPWFVIVKPWGPNFLCSWAHVRVLNSLTLKGKWTLSHFYICFGVWWPSQRYELTGLLCVWS